MALSPVKSVEAVGPDVLGRLGLLCEARGLGSIAQALESLRGFVEEDLQEVESALASPATRDDRVGQSVMHLLSLGGKRLRPLCVLLASQVGKQASGRAHHLAVAVELVHNATLLHDDVIDLGTMRRGRPTARLVYGNAASIFAGDWLLIDALRRVRKADSIELLDRLLDTIDEMIAAESLQLETRGSARADRDTYFRIIEGKTASLFRWAMFAGARIGGLSLAPSQSLEAYGRHLGLAFQAVDDALDFAGDEARTGKGLLADLREGKPTYPLIVAMERSIGLRALVEEALAVSQDAPFPVALASAIQKSVVEAGGVEACMVLAKTHATRARTYLDCLPSSRATTALEVVVEATIHRDW